MSLSKHLFESVNVTVDINDHRRFVKAVALAYNARPIKEKDRNLLKSWDFLSQHTSRMFKRMSANVKVEWVEGQPYESAEEMNKKVKETGVLQISKDFSDNHQIWKNEEDNWKFRAVHDYIVHIGGKVDFSIKGEIKAYKVHGKIVPPDALPALFSEVVGQVCYVDVYGEFPDPQKACVLYGFDYKKVGVINWTEYRKNFTENPKHQYSESKIDQIIKSVES